MKVPLLNSEGGPGVPLLNFEGGPEVPLLNFEGGPGDLVPLLHHAKEENISFKNILSISKVAKLGKRKKECKRFWVRKIYEA